MKSKFKSVNDQKLKQDKATLESHLHHMHRHKKIGDFTTDCPVCKRKGTLAVVINEKTAVAKCGRCDVGVQVKFEEVNNVQA